MNDQKKYRIISNGESYILQKRFLKYFWIYYCYTSPGMHTGKFLIGGPPTMGSLPEFKTEQFALDALNEYFEYVRKEKEKKEEKRRVARLKWNPVKFMEDKRENPQ